MGNSERVEGQESLHTAGGPTDYLWSATVSNKTCIENQNTHFIRSKVVRKSCRLCDKLEKYCRAGRSQMTIYYGACTFHPGYLRLQIHTLVL